MILKVYSKNIRKSINVEINNNLSLEELVGKIQKGFNLLVYSDNNNSLGSEENEESYNCFDELFDDTHTYFFFTHLKGSEYRLRYEGSVYVEYNYDHFLNDTTLKSAKKTNCIIAMPEIKSKLLFVFDYFGSRLGFIITRIL